MIKELSMRKQNIIIKLLITFVEHFKNRESERYQLLQLCNQCSRDKEYFEMFKDFQSQGVCDNCHEIKNCIDLEVADILRRCRNGFGFYEGRYLSGCKGDDELKENVNKEYILFLKEKNIPFLRGYITLGDFIDGKKTISLNSISDNIYEQIKLFQNPVYNVNYDIFKSSYSGGYSLMNQFNDSREHSRFIKGINKYIKDSENIDSVIVKPNELFPYTKEHMKSLLNLNNELNDDNDTQILNYIENIPEERFNLKDEVELFLYFNIIDLALKNIKTKSDGSYIFSLFLIDGFILDKAREETLMGQYIIGLLRRARKYGLSIIMVNNRNELVRS